MDDNDNVVVISDFNDPAIVTATNIRIADGIHGIKDYAFHGCGKLKKIELPHFLRIIGKFAFRFSSLEEIVIPDSVQEIGDGAFSKCFMIKKIRLPKNIKTIEYSTFAECESLEYILIPDGVTEIKKSAFHDCLSLKELVIPEGVKQIGDFCFSGCSLLKKIVIPSSVKKIGDYSFDGCSNLTEIVLPINGNLLLDIVKHDNLDYVSYETFSSVKKVTLTYSSFSELIKNLGGFSFFDIFNKSFPSADLNFSGPKLNFFEKRLVQLQCSKKVYFIDKLEFKSNDNRREVSNDSDIQSIVDDIYSLCDKLPLKIKEMIYRKISVLLDEYEDRKVKLKPNFDQEDVMLSDEYGSLVNLKPKLLSELVMIRLSLSSKSDLINFLVDLDKYMELLDNDNFDLSSNIESIENMIKNIIYYSKYVDNNKKNSYLRKLEGYIRDAINFISDELNISDDSGLKLNSNLDVRTKFRMNISALYDEVYGYASKIIPFKKMLIDLVTTDEVDKVDDDVSIASLVGCIQYSINHFSNKEYSYKLTGMLLGIINKYSDKINQMLEEPDKLNELVLGDLEIKLRKELQSLIELIRANSFIDEYESSKVSKFGFDKQLTDCLTILDGGKIVPMSEEQGKELFTSAIIDINNEVLSNNLIDDNDKSKIILEIINIVKKYLNDVQNNSIDGVMDFQKKFLSDINNIKLRFYKFVDRIEEYNRHIR